MPAILRNGGGRVTEDTLRSVRTLAAIMGNGKSTVGAVAVVHHEDCGLRNFGDDQVKELLKEHSELDEQRSKEVDAFEIGSLV